MVLAGHSKAKIVSALRQGSSINDCQTSKAATMVSAMSKSAYSHDAGDHNALHVMFFTALTDGKDWGTGASGSLDFAGPYWFLSCRPVGVVRLLVTLRML